MAGLLQSPVEPCACISEDNQPGQSSMHACFYNQHEVFATSPQLMEATENDHDTD